MRWTLVLALLICQYACDDGGGDPLPDMGPDANSVDQGSDLRDGAVPDGAAPDDCVSPDAPEFFIAAPGMDEVLAGTAELRIETDSDAIAGIAVRIDAMEIGRDEFAGDRLAVDLVPADLPDGAQTLAVDALDGDGTVLATRTVNVRIVASPPAASMIGMNGGALQTPNGVIVIVPPGAVDEPRGFRVQDRALDSLPDVVGDRPFELLQAIDLLPMEGAPDPSFRFLRPARILFPVEDHDDAQQAGSSPPFVGNIGAGPGGPDLRFVSTVRVGGGWAASGGAGATVTGVQNLSRSGEPLQSLDLVQLTGEGFPTKPYELRVRLDGRAPIDVMVGPGGRTARFVIPPGVTGDPVRIELINRKDARRQVVEVAVGARAAAMPTVAEADARIAMLFDGIDGQIEQFRTGDYVEADVPQVSEINAMRAQMQQSLGMPIDDWQGVFAEARADMMALSNAERQQIGAVLGSLEENLAAVSAAGPLLLTQDEACLSLLLMDMFLEYFNFVTGIIPNWTPPGLLKSALLNTAMAMVDYTAKSVGCDEEDDEDEGIWGYECDLLMMAQQEEKTAGVNGDIIGFGPRSPGGMGLDGLAIFDVFANAMFFMEGVGIRLVDPLTGESAALFTDLTLDDGTFTIPFVTPDTTVDAVLTLPDGTEIVIPIPTPGDGEMEYIPIFIPVPDFEDMPDADFPFVAQTGASIGLLDDVNSGGPAVADFDDDGLPDAYFPAREPGFGQEFLLQSLARNLGGGQFQTFEYGPFPNEGFQRTAQLNPVAVDVDGDGDLDLIGPGPSGTGGFNVQPLAEMGFVPGTTYNSPQDGVRCTHVTGLAVGDFIAGDGPDVVVYSFANDAQNNGAQVMGARCVFQNQGDGTFVQASAEPMMGYGNPLGSIAGVADLDVDGHLDIYLPIAGIIAFGNGNGGFEEIRVPDACWQSNAGIIDFFSNQPAILDVDRDGDLDLVSPPKKAIEFGAQGVVETPVGACILQNDGARGFTPLPAPALNHPEFDDCLGVPCTQLSPADVNADGYVDLLMYHHAIGFRLALGGPAGFEAGPIFEINDGVGFKPADFNGDGRVDFAVGSRDESDFIFINQTPNAGGHITVDLRDAGGAPGGRGAHVQVDLDGDGDFDTGPQAGAVGDAGAVFIGIGRADAVDVRVRFIDRDAPGGHVVEQRVDAGARVQVADPQ